MLWRYYLVIIFSLEQAINFVQDIIGELSESKTIYLKASTNLYACSMLHVRSYQIYHFYNERSHSFHAKMNLNCIVPVL
jgi:hypothetical protein